MISVDVDSKMDFWDIKYTTYGESGTQVQSSWSELLLSITIYYIFILIISSSYKRLEMLISLWMINYHRYFSKTC